MTVTKLYKQEILVTDIPSPEFRVAIVFTV